MSGLGSSKRTSASDSCRAEGAIFALCFGHFLSRAQFRVLCAPLSHARFSCVMCASIHSFFSLCYRTRLRRGNEMCCAASSTTPRRWRPSPSPASTRAPIRVTGQVRPSSVSLPCAGSGSAAFVASVLACVRAHVLFAAWARCIAFLTVAEPTALHCVVCNCCSLLSAPTQLMSNSHSWVTKKWFLNTLCVRQGAVPPPYR